MTNQDIHNLCFLLALSGWLNFRGFRRRYAQRPCGH